MIDSNVVRTEPSRTMLTSKQLKETFVDAEGKRIFSDYMIQTLTREGSIPFVRLHSRRILFCKESVEEWLRQQELKSMLQPIEANRFGLKKL